MEMRDGGRLTRECKRMKACVTGATGLIGAAVVRKLIAAGGGVRALVRTKDAARVDGVEIVAGDVRDAAAVAAAVRGCEVVFHLAAKVNGPASLDEFVAVNVGGTECVLRAAESVRRVVYVSSIAVYGRVANGEKIDESTALEAVPEKRDAYSHSKILAERAAVEVASAARVALTIVRPGVVYGSGHPPPPGLQAFNVGRNHFVFGRPEWHIPLAYVENVADALIAAAERVAGPGTEDFNLVDDDALTLGKYHAVRNELEGSRTVFLSENPLIAGAAVFGGVARAVTKAEEGFSRYQLERSLQDRFYDCSKVRGDLGWEARVELREALKGTLVGRG